MIVEMEELTAQAGLTSDAPAEDLLLLQQKGDAAQNHIERLLGVKIDTMPETPPALKEAVLQLACWWFNNRETVIEREQLMPFGVWDIINEYREWTF